MPQMTIFECQKHKNMTRVKNKVISKGCFRVYIMTLTIVPEILIPQLYTYSVFFLKNEVGGISIGRPIYTIQFLELCKIGCL
jgi:hypothetical protein